MLGCMIETSIGATAMAHLAGLADWVDLDSPLLIANDPFDGIQYDERGRHSPARTAGNWGSRPVEPTAKDLRVWDWLRMKFFDAHCDAVMHAYDGDYNFVGGAAQRPHGPAPPARCRTPRPGLRDFRGSLLLSGPRRRGRSPRAPSRRCTGGQTVRQAG